MEFRLWGRGNKSSLDTMEPDKRGYLTVSPSWIIQRKQFFEQEGCRPETIRMMDLLLDYMAHKKLKAIKLRSNHYIFDSKEFYSLRKQHKI